MRGHLRTAVAVSTAGSASVRWAMASTSWRASGLPDSTWAAAITSARVTCRLPVTVTCSATSNGEKNTA